MMGMPGETYTFGPARLVSSPIAAPQILDLFLCESQRLVLRPNQLYRFRVDPDCEKCKAIEAEGRP